ncbi:hypothetical protein SDC9_53254 [bioreactor metagenome]|uniref:Tetratricopeptide repeat protein n=1 Tax=bioreactor metagenome TaxID=1076179 RepID=A0A644WSV8_9ZZZZ
MKMFFSLLIAFAILILPILSVAQQSGEGKPINPTAIEFNNKAVVLMTQDECDSALFYFDKAIEADSNYMPPHSSKSKIYVINGQYDLALNETESAIKIKPDQAEAWAFAGVIIEFKGDTLKAKDYFKKSIEIFDARISNPDMSNFIFANKFNRAISLILLGNEKEGKNELNKIKEDFSEFSMIIDEYLKLSRQEIVQTILGTK